MEEIKLWLLGIICVLVMGWCCIANNAPADGTVKWRQEGWMEPSLRGEKRDFLSSHGIAPAQKLNSGLGERTPFPLLEMASPVPVLRAAPLCLRFAISKFYWEQKEISRKQFHPDVSQNVTFCKRCCISLWEFKVKTYQNGEATGIFQVWSAGSHYDLH